MIKQNEPLILFWTAIGFSVCAFTGVSMCYLSDIATQLHRIADQLAK